MSRKKKIEDFFFKEKTHLILKIVLLKMPKIEIKKQYLNI